MSQSKPDHSKHDISQQHIIDFLKAHPDFFQHHPDLLTELSLPQQKPQPNHDGTTPLITHQLKQLQEANKQYQHRLKQLITHAKHNEHLFSLTRALVIQLIPIHSMDHVHQTLANTLSNAFNIDYVRCVLFKEVISTELTTWPIQPQADLIQHIPSLNQDKIICGFLRPQELHFLFAEQATNIQSSALALLHYQKPLGYIALGSQDREQFKHTMGTLFIEYIAQALSAKITQLTQ